MLFVSPSRSLRVVALAGSPTPRSRSTALLRAALAALSGLGPAALIELRELPAAALVQGDIGHPGLAEPLSAVAAADVVLVATPIYQASFSGLLKSFLDLLPQRALSGKTVLPLATGGSAAHLLAIDYALKPVLGALGARHTLDPVFATDAQFTTDELGLRLPGDEAISRLTEALDPLLRHRAAWAPDPPPGREAAAEHARCRA